jgi:pimeloyl-ACP methyl ester carboxylesterase
MTAREALRLLHRVWVLSGCLLLLAMPVYVWWTYAARIPASALRSDDAVSVSADPLGLRFSPRGAAKGVGLIWVAGCLVGAEAYAPLGHAVATRGYPVVIYALPWKCAPWAAHRARVDRELRRLLATSRPDRWVLGGHSKGAVFVSAIAATPPPALRGVVIAGSTHPRDVDLSHSPLAFTKVLATRDGIAPLETSQSHRALLPPAVDWRRIEGGNHSQFGWYGTQLGDGTATVSREAQQRALLDAVLDRLRSVEPQ